MLKFYSSTEYFWLWGSTIEPPSPPPQPYPSASCPTPAFAPVTATTPVSPGVWFAGKTYDIVITGSGFTTPANASDSCFATQIGVSVNTGSVALSNVIVVNSTTITATVAPAETDPAEMAEVQLYGGPCCERGGDVVRAGANAAPMANNAKPAEAPALTGGPLVAQTPDLVLPTSEIHCIASMKCTQDPITKDDGAGQQPTPQYAVVGQQINLTTYPTAEDLNKLGFSLTVNPFLNEGNNWTVDGTIIGG